MSDGQCELHGGTIRDQFGNHVCCVQEQWSIFPTAPPPSQPCPPPPGTREKVAALLHRTNPTPDELATEPAQPLTEQRERPSVGTTEEAG